MTRPHAAPTHLPAVELFADVVGQEQAVAALRAAAARPVHAYLLRGAAGNGGLVAAQAFAAALLCPDGGCGTCRTCRAALAGNDPDLHFIHRSGATLSVPDMRRLVALAQRRPLQAARQVVIVTDVHLGGPAAPALLKTLEEPPGATVFVLAGRRHPPRTGDGGQPLRRRSRSHPCPGPPWCTGSSGAGVPDDVAAVVADSSGGNLERARVMIEDPEVAARAALWSSVPDQLNDTGRGGGRAGPRPPRLGRAGHRTVARRARP